MASRDLFGSPHRLALISNASDARFLRGSLATEISPLLSQCRYLHSKQRSFYVVSLDVVVGMPPRPARVSFAIASRSGCCHRPRTTRVFSILGSRQADPNVYERESVGAVDGRDVQAK